jgi:hypothetical protein
VYVDGSVFFLSPVSPISHYLQIREALSSIEIGRDRRYWRKNKHRAVKKIIKIPKLYLR